MLETLYSQQSSLQAKVDKLSDKIDILTARVGALESQMAAVSTKLDFISWIGAAIGLLILGSLYKQFTDGRTGA